MENKTKALLLIFLIALSVRLFPYILINANSTKNALYEADSDEYIGMGRALAKGDFLFSSASWFPLFRTPGYPIFLSLFYYIGFNDMQISLFQIFLDSFSALLLYKLVSIITKNTSASILAGIFYSINPLLFSFSFQILSETFFMFIFLITNILFFITYSKNSNGIKKIDIWVLGFLFSFLIWIRPVSILFPFIYSFIFYLKHRNFFAPGIFILLPIIFITFWTARNYYVGNNLTFSGIALWNFVCYYPGYIVSDPAANTSGWEGFIEEYSIKTPALCTDFDYEKLSTGLTPALKFISQNLMIFIKQTMLGALTLFEPTKSYHITLTMSLNQAHYSNILSSFEIFSFSYQSLLYILSFIYLINFKNEKHTMLKDLNLLVILLFLGTIFINGPNNYHRYRMPLEPFFIIFAVQGLVFINQLRNKTKC